MRSAARTWGTRRGKRLLEEGCRCPVRTPVVAGLSVSPRTHHERRAPLTRGVAGPWRGQRRSLARLCPVPPVRPSPRISVRASSGPGGAGPGSWRPPLTLTRRGSGAAEQMFAATGTAAGVADVTGCDKALAPLLGTGLLVAAAIPCRPCTDTSCPCNPAGIWGPTNAGSKQNQPRITIPLRLCVLGHRVLEGFPSQESVRAVGTSCSPPCVLGPVPSLMVQLDPSCPQCGTSHVPPGWCRGTSCDPSAGLGESGQCPGGQREQLGVQRCQRSPIKPAELGFYMAIKDNVGYKVLEQVLACELGGHRGVGSPQLPRDTPAGQNPSG